jgi:hypothetical protein
MLFIKDDLQQSLSLQSAYCQLILHPAPLSSFNIFRRGRICKLFCFFLHFLSSSMHRLLEDFKHKQSEWCPAFFPLKFFLPNFHYNVNFLCTGEGVKWNPNSMSRVVPRHVKTTCDQLSAHTSASSGTTNNLERHKSQSDSCVSVKVRPANLWSAERVHERH